MSNIEKIKEILEKEYDENCAKIDELHEKIRTIKENDFETKLTGVFAFSIIPWVAIMVLLPMIIKFDIIPVNFISPLSIGVPALIGITGETLLTKKNKCKKRLATFSKSKSQKEKIEESTKYEIEREKLRSSNKILKKAYDNLDAKQNLFNQLSNKYNIVEKEHDNRCTSEIKLNIEKISEFLNQKQKNIDTITTKSVLKEKFWRIRDRFQKVSDFIIISMLGGAGFMMLYDMPIIAINHLGNNIQLQSGILSILAPLGIGVVVCGGYALKRTKDHIYAFRSANKELGKEALSETTNDSELKRKTYNNDVECFGIELENLINDTCAVKLQLEFERQKLDNITQISDAESIMKDSMKKIDHKELVCDKGPSIEEELQFDDRFIDVQGESYENLLESSLIQKVQGPRLVKTKTPQNGKINN